MKYLNIKRYKFSTVVKKLTIVLKDVLEFINFINPKKFLIYFIDIKDTIKRKIKYLDPRKYNILDIVQRTKLKGNKFLFYHLPAFIVFFGFLYLLIPTFFNYDKSRIEKIICIEDNFECLIRGDLDYSFFPTPRLKINDVTINIVSKNKTTLLTSSDVSLKLSIKNLLAKEKHKIKKIVFHNFESVISLDKIKDYNNIFDNKYNFVPIVFTNGTILLYDQNKYIIAINNVDLVSKFTQESSKAKLKGKFLNNDIVFNIDSEMDDNVFKTKLEMKIKQLGFLTKIEFLNSIQNVKNGKFLIKKDKNKFTGIFDFKDNQLIIQKSNLRNTFIDGKVEGKLIFFPYFNFDLDVVLNSINFTRIYNYFLVLDQKNQKNLFKISNKINGKMNFSADKVYSKNNLVKSFESRIKFYNGNIKIDQFLINLGKLGAADLLGRINNSI